MQVAADPAAETADKPKEAPATAIRRGGRTRRTTMQVESDAEAEPGPATAEPEATEAPEPAQKRRGRPPKAQAAAAAQEGGEVAAAQKNPRERTTSKRGKSPAAAEQPEAAVAEPEPEPEPDVVEQPDARDDATPTPTPTGEAMQVEKATADKGAEMDALPDIAAPADSEPVSARARFAGGARRVASPLPPPLFLFVVLPCYPPMLMLAPRLSLTARRAHTTGTPISSRQAPWTQQRMISRRLRT